MNYSIRGRGRRRAFTLVELMIVVAIIGILAALAIYGADKYLAAAKAAEAKGHVGAMSRAATGAYERESAAAEIVGEAAQSTALNHQLCDSATPVPLLVPQGKKYQPETADGLDFNGGDVTTGWRCLRFDLQQPIYYQYQYTRDGSPVAPTNPAACAVECYEAGALGDLDADGTAQSAIARTGKINPVTHGILASTYLHVQLEEE